MSKCDKLTKLTFEYEMIFLNFKTIKDIITIKISRNRFFNFGIGFISQKL